MGQDSSSSQKPRKIFDLQEQPSSSSQHDNSKMDMLEQTFVRNRVSSRKLSQENIKNLIISQQEALKLKKQLEREQKLLEFMGEIIYYCKKQLRNKKKNFYKISALMFYKYFLDKFRELQQKYYCLYKKDYYPKELYEQKVMLVHQIKDTYLKIRKFVYEKIPFFPEEIKVHLDAESKTPCYKDKDYFSELYKQIRFIMDTYSKNSKGEFDDYSTNICYLRMLKAIFIIEQLQFNNPLIKVKEGEEFPNYEIQKLQTLSEQEFVVEMLQANTLFSTIERS